MPGPKASKWHIAVIGRMVNHRASRSGKNVWFLSRHTFREAIPFICSTGTLRALRNDQERWLIEVSCFDRHRPRAQADGVVAGGTSYPLASTFWLSNEGLNWVPLRS